MSKTSPQHYQLRNGFQVIDLTETLDFCSGNVVKYVARAGNKDGESALDDLLKAKWYLERKIENARITEDTQVISPKNERLVPCRLDRVVGNGQRGSQEKPQ